MTIVIVLGCLEVGEKFPVGEWGGGGGVFSIAKTKLHQPEVRLRLGWAVTIKNVCSG